MLKITEYGVETVFGNLFLLLGDPQTDSNPLYVSIARKLYPLKNPQTKKPRWKTQSSHWIMAAPAPLSSIIFPFFRAVLATSSFGLSSAISMFSNSASTLLSISRLHKLYQGSNSTSIGPTFIGRSKNNMQTGRKWREFGPNIFWVQYRHQFLLDIVLCIYARDAYQASRVFLLTMFGPTLPSAGTMLSILSVCLAVRNNDIISQNLLTSLSLLRTARQTDRIDNIVPAEGKVGPKNREK